MTATAHDDIAYLTTLADQLDIPYRADLDVDGNAIYQVFSHHSDRDNMVVIATLDSAGMENWVHATEERDDKWKYLSDLASRSFDDLANGLAKGSELGV